MLAAGGLGLSTALAAASPAQATDFQVTNLADTGAGSLRQAVLDSNAALSSDRILFKSSLSGQITLTSGEMNVSDGVEIVGPGAGKLAVSGNDASQILQIYPPGTGFEVTISGLKLTHGTGFDGGAIYNANATLTISKSVISDNTAAYGGGVGNGAFGGPSPPLTIIDSTIAGNEATPYCCGAVYTNGDITIERSTISGNRSAGRGGGIGVFGGADTHIDESTISGNSALAYSGGGLYISGGGGSRGVLNTIFADNTAPNGPDVRTAVGALPAAFSLIENPSGTIVTGQHTLTGVDPKLGPLRDNGGPTPTQALAASSPALDAGSATVPDQRGAPRPFDLAGEPQPPNGTGSDIGAYERVLCGGVLVNRVGTAGKNKLKGTNKADGLLGLGGNDLLLGRGGNDALCGGSGRDRLKGGGGKDKLLGGPGRDRLIGGPGRDQLKGGPGKDKQIQ